MIVHTYNDFMQISINMNRSTQKLDKSLLENIQSLKKKLNISTFEIRSKPKQTFIKKEKREICDVYKILNKITEKNFDTLYGKMVIILDEINDDDTKMNVCEKIFEIASSNMFYSSLFARLSSLLFERYSNFKSIFDEKLSLYYKEFDNIVFVSSNDNYDAYCEYIKKIESLKSFMSFLINLNKYNLFSSNKIINLIIDFQDKVLEGLMIKIAFMRMNHILIILLLH